MKREFSNGENVGDQWKILRRQAFRNGILLGIAVTLFSITALGSARNLSISATDSVRTKELIIEDEQGNPRIVLSSNIADIEGRKRTDKLEGILLMDEEGVDRAVLGLTPTFQRNGKMSSRGKPGPMGLVFNDEKGDERGGFGYYEDKKIVALGMDRSVGEGLAMFVADEGLFGQKVGFVMSNEKRQQVVYLGATTAGDSMLILDTPEKGRLSFVMDADGVPGATHSDRESGKEVKLLEGADSR